MTHNTSTCVSQNYNIVEDLAQATSPMSTLEFLQTCLAQWKALLSTIGGVDPQDSMLQIFEMEKIKPHLSLQLAF